MEEYNKEYKKDYKVERFETYIDMTEFFEKYFDFSVTHAKCQACPGYRGTWACPDFDFDTKEFLSKFKRFHFILDRVSNSGAATVDEAKDRLFFEKDRYDAEMRDIESSIPGSYGLAAQECVACKKCARLSGLPCVHPEIMRYGLESIGAFPTKMVPDKFGFPILWSDGTSIPEYYVLAGGVFEP